MSERITRRETLKRGLAATSLLALMSDWTLPALAQGETEVHFTDIPADFKPNNPNATTRIFDIRNIDGPFTPTDQFFAVQHFNRPEIDGAAYRLKTDRVGQESNRIFSRRSSRYALHRGGRGLRMLR